MSKTLYLVVGPTAVGKTSYAIEMAKALNTEIVSADSRQIFRQMNIGVARPSEEELKEMKHHLVAAWNVWEDYSVARYEKEAMEIISALFKRHDDVVLCGGSGMYINAVLYGIDNIPEADKSIREALNDEFLTYGIDSLLKELKAKDPLYYDVVDKSNPRRIIRALEVIRSTSNSFSSYLGKKNIKRDFVTKVIFLKKERQELIKSIDFRTDMMISEGLVSEVYSLREYRHLPALSTVGYKEIFDYFDGNISLPKTIEQIKIHTHQYAKRQMTWFNKQFPNSSLDVLNMN